MVVSLRVPLQGLAYERRFSAEIDVIGENILRVHGRLEDHRIAVAHDWTVRTPDYEVITAGATTVAEGQAADVCSSYAGLGGVRIGRGFSKRVADVLGETEPWCAEHLQLAVEMARVTQQIYQFPDGFDRRFPIDGAACSPQALVSWQQDRAYMRGLANSCYTYSDACAGLLATQDVVSHVGPALTRPQVGTRAAFRRKKWLMIRREGAGARRGFNCQSGMHDNLHDIAVKLWVSADGTISAAKSTALRLPYSGLCETPQARTSSLNGQHFAPDLIRLLAERLGGKAGCTHLFDLSADCLRLFAF
jgi:hypothetical protein